jgi:hypothetical protein
MRNTSLQDFVKMQMFHPCKKCLARPICKSQCYKLEQYSEQFTNRTLFISIVCLIDILILLLYLCLLTFTIVHLLILLVSVIMLLVGIEIKVKAVPNKTALLCLLVIPSFFFLVMLGIIFVLYYEKYSPVKYEPD